MAALNSIYIILFSQVTNLISTFVQGEIPSTKWEMLIGMMISGAIGGYVGRRIAKHIDNEKTDRHFFVLLGIIVLLGIYNIVQYATAEGILFYYLCVVSERLSSFRRLSYS